MESHETFDPEPYRAFIAAKSKKHQKELLDRVRRAREFLPVLVDAFRTIDPDIERIILFGSLARGIPKSGTFDIDIGVLSSRYLRLVAWALDQEWKIDVVELDSLDGTVLQGIEDGAEVLYER